MTAREVKLVTMFALLLGVVFGAYVEGWRGGPAVIYLLVICLVVGFALIGWSEHR